MNKSKAIRMKTKGRRTKILMDFLFLKSSIFFSKLKYFHCYMSMNAALFNHFPTSEVHIIKIVF